MTSAFPWRPGRALPAAALALLLACQAHAETWLVGPSGQPMALAQALSQARDGDTIQVLPGLYKGQVGVINQRRLRIVGLDPRPVLDADGQHAEGKATWIVRDGDITIENIEFRNNRVPDGNGAGIRFEKGHLTLRRCRFIDNQNGLLTANFGDAELDIVDSEFAQAPRSVGSLPHLLYAGRIARLSVTGSRFHQGFEGHLIKSRARESRIAYNLIVDGPGGAASYEIDLPNGGDAVIIGNVIGQSRDAQNPALVAYGAEGRAWERNRLLLSHNTLVSDFPLAWYLRTWPEKLGDDTEIRAINNLTVGAGLFWLGASGSFEGNFPAFDSMLVEPSLLDFALKPDSILRGRADDAGAVLGPQARPAAEFRLPIGTRPIQPPVSWSPGAFQR